MMMNITYIHFKTVTISYSGGMTRITGAVMTCTEKKKSSALQQNYSLLKCVCEDQTGLDVDLS